MLQSGNLPVLVEDIPKIVIKYFVQLTATETITKIRQLLKRAFAVVILSLSCICWNNKLRYILSE